jgi:hypothetical protein
MPSRGARVAFVRQPRRTRSRSAVTAALAATLSSQPVVQHGMVRALLGVPVFFWQRFVNDPTQSNTSGLRCAAALETFAMGRYG